MDIFAPPYLLGVLILTLMNSPNSLGVNFTNLNCSNLPESYKITVPELDACNDGYFLRCVDLGRIETARCPLEIFGNPWTRMKFDTGAQKCIERDELDCNDELSLLDTRITAAMRELFEKKRSVGPAHIIETTIRHLDNFTATGTEPTRAMGSLNVHSKTDPLQSKKACPISVNCSSLSSGQKIPIPILVDCDDGYYCECEDGYYCECDDGYYCECEDSGLTLRQCPFNSLFSMKHEKLDAKTLECLQRDEFDCAEWLGITTTTSSTSTTTQASTTASPSATCPISANCSALSIGRKIPIPILEQCDDGYYCECEESGLALERCPKNTWWWLFSKYERLDADTLKCVKSQDFDCASWIDSLTTTSTSSSESTTSDYNSTSSTISTSTSTSNPTTASTSSNSTYSGSTIRTSTTSKATHHYHTEFPTGRPTMVPEQISSTSGSFDESPFSITVVLLAVHCTRRIGLSIV